MAWTNIANANLDVGAPIRSVDILALRDNITALANGDTGAPAIKAAAFQSGQTGNAPIFAPRAWVNFDATNAFTPNPSTSAIRASGNVSSVTRQATGQYRINFAVAMIDNNYNVSTSLSRGGLASATVAGDSTYTPNASYVDIVLANASNNTINPPSAHVCILR